MKRSLIILAGSVFGTAATVFAGPYSPGKGGAAESGYVDAGIAGFVGPAGEGVVATASNGNYINPIFTGWATGYTLYAPSDIVGTYGQNGIGSQFANPALALGPVTGDNMNIVSLGDMSMSEIAAYKSGSQTNKPGTLILTVANPICNGAGADFAAFENGFVSNYTTGAGSTAGTMFAELGFVEVSTDGIIWSRFPSIYLNYPNASLAGETDNKIDLDGNGIFNSADNTAYLTQDVSNIYNLVGKHSNAYGISWGTPFDLDDLLTDANVVSGDVDLNNINYVKIVDIPGNGTFTDSEGNPIFDAWVTWGSGGLDFEALGVINSLEAVPEPSTWALMLSSGAMATLWARRRMKTARK